MKALAFTALIREPEPGAFLVTFPAIPEAITQGDSREAAIEAAGDALSAALEVYVDEGREAPQDQPQRPAAGEQAVEVAVEPAIAARLLLAHEMRARNLSKVALGELMKRDEKTVRRILSGKGASLDLTLAALRAVGVRPALAA
jgi:antitoxin HicB